MRIIVAQTKDVRRGVAGRVRSWVVAQWCVRLLTPALGVRKTDPE